MQSQKQNLVGKKSKKFIFVLFVYDSMTYTVVLPALGLLFSMAAFSLCKDKEPRTRKGEKSQSDLFTK